VVQTQAKKYGLTEVQANHLALLACNGMRWNQRKFSKFLLDRVPPTSLSERDPLFFLLERLSPSPEDLQKTLKNIYYARSSSLHSGSALPRSIAIGTSPWTETRNLPLDPLESDDIPPVAWFERVVYLAVRKFLLDQTAVRSLPFVEAAD
jgi:hypothetical protein